MDGGRFKSLDEVLPSRTEDIQGGWGARTFLTTSTTLNGPLSDTNRNVWGTERTLFLDHGIPAYQGSERTMAPLQRFEALGQMLVTNQRLDKLAAACLVFTQKGMLDGPPVLQGIVHNVATVDRRDEEEDEAQAIEGDKSVYDVRLARKPGEHTCYITKYTTYMRACCCPLWVSRAHGLHPALLYDQLNPDAEMPGDQIDLRDCPMFNGDIKVFNSASATYHAPSDHSGQGGMHRDIIRCTPQWRGGAARYDCVFVDGGGSEDDPLGVCGGS
ncbi:hypothetical protein HD554DRAFT_2036900, partial [Boletus coccyginus]